MILELFLVWLFIFALLMIINIVETSYTFGIVGGMWLIVLGGLLVLDGLQYQSGTTIVTSGATQTITSVYSDALLPYSTYSIVWGISFIALSVYIMYANAEARMGKK
jgi:hypothetical protein